MARSDIFIHYYSRYNELKAKNERTKQLIREKDEARKAKADKLLA